MNSPTKIIFDCKSDDNKISITNKTNKFNLNAICMFNNEIIYFFNINPNKFSIFISLEINQKKYNFKDSEVILLNNILSNGEKDEINYKLSNEINLSLNIKILDKFNKKDLFEYSPNELNESNQYKKNISEKKAIETGIPIQERIKIFSAKDKENKTINMNQYKPGKLRIPPMFQNSNDINNNKEKNTKPKSRKGTMENTCDENIDINEKINAKEEQKNQDSLPNNENENIEKKNLIKEIINETKEQNKLIEINIEESKDKEEKEDKKEEINKNEEYDFQTKLNIINENNNNPELDDLYEEREYTSEEEKENEKEEIKGEENEDENIKITEEKKISGENIKKENDYIFDSENLENLNINKEKDDLLNNNEEKINPNKNNIPVENKNLQNLKSINYSSTISYRQQIKGIPSFKSSSGEIFLESQNYAKYLKSLQQKGLKESKRETFCEGFFISSFPYKNASVVEKSQFFPSPCGHEECSKLPSMKPEIIMRYPLKDTKNLEMNNLAASICFPTGIKVCYSEEKLSIIKDFVTPITNQKGERYYMMTFHFYKKYSRDDYVKKYEMHPLKHHLMRFGDAYLGLDEEQLTENQVKEIQHSLELCQELGFRDFIYVPYCLCVISKYPYINQLQICLKIIHRIISKNNLINYASGEEASTEINNLLMHLIHGVPIPDQNSSIKFFLPYYNKKIEIFCPKIDDININVRTISLLTIFSIEHIITIYKLILSEKRILFIDKYYDRLAEVTDSFITLLYPLQWIHTYIPIMSDQMIKYVETFLPYINGIHDSLLPLVKNAFKENDEENEEIFLVFVDEDKIKLGSWLYGNKSSKSKYINDNIPPFPSELEKKLKNKLKKIKNELNSEKSGESFELEMRDSFIDFFVDMFGNYGKYLYLLDEQEIVFNKALFLNTIHNHDKKFYSDLIDTQLFQNFIQNIIKDDLNYYFNKLNSKEKEKENNKDKKIKDKKKESQTEKYIKNKNNNLINYVVAPNYLNIRDAEVRNIEKSLRKKYNMETNEILEPERIVSELAEIDNNKFINNNCLIYMTPEQIKAEQGSFRNKNAELRRSEMPKYTGTFMILKAKMNVKMAIRSSITEPDNNEKKKTQMKEYVKDIIVKIFKSQVDDIDSDMKNSFMSIIEMSFGREYFISLISHNEKVFYLQRDAFKLLANFIYNTLIATLKIDETDKVIEETVILINCCKYFAMEEKGKTTTIYEDYKKKIQYIPKITQYNFWKKKFFMTSKYSKNKVESKKNDESINKNIIYDMSSEMIDLQINKGTIKSILERLTNELFGKDSEASKEVLQVIKKQISQARYISKVKS